jgi:hypothetical protein
MGMERRGTGEFRGVLLAGIALDRGDPTGIGEPAIPCRRSGALLQSLARSGASFRLSPRIGVRRIANLRSLSVFSFHTYSVPNPDRR